jgi:hypothetical protein
LAAVAPAAVALGVPLRLAGGLLAEGDADAGPLDAAAGEYGASLASGSGPTSRPASRAGADRPDAMNAPPITARTTTTAAAAAPRARVP